MKKFSLLLIPLFLFVLFCNSAIAKQWPAIGLTGGGNALDGIDTSECSDGDIALVYKNVNELGYYLIYHYRSESTATEKVPVVIAPDIGSGRWRLSRSCYNSATYVLEDPTTDENFGSIRLTHAGTIVRVVTVVKGTSPYVDFNVKHFADRSQDGTSLFSSNKRANSITTGNVWTLTNNDFTNPTFTASQFLWIRTSATGGTVDEISITVFYVYHS